MTHQIQIVFDQNCYKCYGAWSITHLNDLSIILQNFINTQIYNKDDIIFDGQNIMHFDSAGALFLIETMHKLQKYSKKIILQNFSATHQSLIDLVIKKNDNLQYKSNIKYKPEILYNVGKEVVNKIQQIDAFIVLIGDLSTKVFLLFTKINKYRWSDIITNIYNAGLKALPILALLSFLIGIVLTYQMGLQLKEYGANNYIAYLSGMAIFREFAPLITAIIVAGRTSSAFTAQIGSMQINEEISALITMGLSPTELLIIPKISAVIFIFPLLIFWSDIFSVFGSMLIANTILHVSYLDFLIRLQDTVGFKQLILGLYKTPAFAVIIVLVGCFQGFAVQNSLNNNIGIQTTKSVVQALFLIIIADALYSVIYSWLGL